MNGYTSGAGATYARYNFNGGLNSFVTAVRDNNSTLLGTPQ